MTNTKRLKQKTLAVNELASSTSKKITNLMIKNTAKKYGLTKDSLKTAFTNFMNFGKVDLRYAGKRRKSKLNFVSPTKLPYYPWKKITSKEAGNLLHEYIFSWGDTAKEFSRKYQLNLMQLYSWIKELTISGKLLGRKVLDPRKYMKIDVKNVIVLEKYSKKAYCKTMSKLDNVHRKGWRKAVAKMSKEEILIHRRVAVVLDKYL